MTIEQLVKSVFPMADEVGIELLIYNITPYPMITDEEQLTKYLQEAFDKGCGTVQGALKWGELDFQRALKGFNETFIRGRG